MSDTDSVEVLPAIMPDSFELLERESERVSAFAAWAQIDVMDGRFVFSRSWPYKEIDSTKEVSERDLPYTPNFEIHLMVQNPEEIGIAFARSGARRVIAHIESFQETADAAKALRAFKEGGASEAGISLLLDTSLDMLVELMTYNIVDVIQVMSIAEIGFQGHDFDSRALDRIADLRTRFPSITISVDGGVSHANARALVDAGANRLAVGSAVMKSPNPKDAYRQICTIVQ